jgi:hypothetical protein
LREIYISADKYEVTFEREISADSSYLGYKFARDLLAYKNKATSERDIFQETRMRSLVREIYNPIRTRLLLRERYQ